MQTIPSSLKKLGARIQRVPRIDILGLFAAIGAYITLVMSHITSWSIWFDEAFTAYLVRFNYVDIARYTATDVHPPFYYWIVKAWTSVWGTNELAFRSLSMVFGVVAIALAFVLLRKLFGKQAALIGALLMAVSPMFVRYGEEARMYTLVTAIVFGATYIPIRAIETNGRKYWALYGILIALGMWTHYFAALAWLAHWAWRGLSLYLVDRVKGRGLIRQFFSKSWIGAHILALILFLPWAPYMVQQFSTIQQGFWIPPVSAHTFTNYFTNVLFYLEQHQVLAWFASLYVLVLAVAARLLYHAYRGMSMRPDRIALLLLISLAFVPPILLFVASMPPLKSSFVERYLVPASVSLVLLCAVIITYGTRHKHKVLAGIFACLLAVSFVIGIDKVYYYGNYNKNSSTSIRTKELTAAIDEKAKPGEPLIATDVWVFYEAVFYTSKDHPVYFLDQTTEYKYGSTDMLKYNDQFKIKNLDAFVQDHPIVWYFGNHGDSQLEAPSIAQGWKQVDSVSVYDPINRSSPYKAVRFRTSAE